VKYAVEAHLRRVYYRWFQTDILPALVARGLTVGRNFYMLDRESIDWEHCWHVTIGDDVTFAKGVRLIAHDASTRCHLGRTRVGKVDVGNRVFIGAGTIVLPGVSIGNNVVVGAGSVVSRDIPDDVVAVGNPARPICTMDEYLDRKRSEMESTPFFGKEYRLPKDARMRAEMEQRMVDRIGWF
jgi:maltose O-acetyltransferase